MVILTEPSEIPNPSDLKNSTVGIQTKSRVLTKGEALESVGTVVYVAPKVAQSSEEGSSSEEPKTLTTCDSCFPTLHEHLDGFAKYNKYTAEKGTTLTYATSSKVQIVLAGVGEKSDFDESENERFGLAGSAVAKALYSLNPENLTIVFVPGTDINDSSLTVFLSRLYSGLVNTTDYKKESDKPRKLKSREVLLYEGKHSVQNLERALRKAEIIAHSQAIAATLVDAPANYCNCKTFVKFIQDRITEHGLDKVLTVTVLDEKQCAEKKMGAFLGVAQGSRHGARLLHIAYKNGQDPKKASFLGKGLTMDTGGYSLKPPKSQTSMKCDMGGAAAVASTAIAVGLLKPENVELHFVCVLTENMVDKDAYRVGDILTASNGKTVCVLNTDAEGRLALIDGLLYAQEQINNNGIVVDCATLTGAVLIGLGAEVAAVYSNKSCLRKKIVKSASTGGEPAWEMPLRQSYLKGLKGSQADLNNISEDGFGGSITAGLFLQQFVNEGVKWAHIDVAGAAWNFKANKSTGWGPSTFIEVIEGLNQHCCSK